MKFIIDVRVREGLEQSTAYCGKPDPCGHAHPSTALRATLRNINNSLDLWRKFFNRRFYARSQRHLIDATADARSFETHFDVFSVLN